MASPDIFQSVTYSTAELDALDRANDTRIGQMGKVAAEKARWVTQVQKNIDAAGLSDQWGVDLSGIYRKDNKNEETA